MPFDFKIEAGKRYRTRGGRIAHIVAVDMPGSHSVWGHLDQGSTEPRSWNARGLFCGPDEFDLIAPVMTAEEVVEDYLRDGQAGGQSTSPLTKGICGALREAGLLKED